MAVILGSYGRMPTWKVMRSRAQRSLNTVSVSDLSLATCIAWHWLGGSGSLWHTSFTSTQPKSSVTIHQLASFQPPMVLICSSRREQAEMVRSVSKYPLPTPTQGICSMRGSYLHAVAPVQDEAVLVDHHLAATPWLWGSTAGCHLHNDVNTLGPIQHAHLTPHECKVSVLVACPVVCSTATTAATNCPREAMICRRHTCRHVSSPRSNSQTSL